MFLLSLITGFFGKFKVELIFLTVIATLALTVYLLFGHIASLKVEKALVEQQAISAKATLDAVVDEQKATNARTEALNKALEQARLDAQKQQQKIQTEDHKKLLDTKPHDLEKKINDAFAAQMQRLEKLSRE